MESIFFFGLNRQHGWYWNAFNVLDRPYKVLNKFQVGMAVKVLSAGLVARVKTHGQEILSHSIQEARDNSADRMSI